MPHPGLPTGYDIDEAIKRALKAREFEDARKLEIEKTEPGYETSEALSDESL